MAKKAFVTGVTGQDGSYLAEWLLGKGYEVHGLMRQRTVDGMKRLGGAIADHGGGFHIHIGSLNDTGRLENLLRGIRPDEIYNLAAFSDRDRSDHQPEETAEVNGMGPLRILETVRRTIPGARFFQASSSEIFGTSPPVPQSETTPLDPGNPYACAKAFAHRMVVHYRTVHGIFGVNGILFNHESPRRGGNFVTRKVIRGLAAILKGEQEEIRLGNLDAKRDWGYAKDYVEAMWLMLQHQEPMDLVLATGESHSVREFVEEAFRLAGLDHRRYVRTDPELVRAAEVPERIGDPSLIRERLGWKAATTFKGLVRLMVQEELLAEGLGSRLLE